MEEQVVCRWIATLTLYITRKGRFDCPGGTVLHSYLIVLLVLLGGIIITLCAVVYVSAQGTIMNPGPRRSMPALVYIRGLLFFPEFVWACLGAVWVSGHSTGCEPAEVRLVTGAVIASWIIFLSMMLGMLVVFDPLGSLRRRPAAAEHAGLKNLESNESSQLFYTARSLARRVWESRLRLLCCCMPQDDNHRAAFSSISQLISDFFSDTDLVPSDIAAGLALLHQEQDKMQLCKDPEDVISHSPSSPIREDLETELEKAAHYMQFAVAAYGWPIFFYLNPLTGCCKLSGDCCRNRNAADYDLVSGDNPGCHFSSILHMTQLQYRDIIHISYHNQIYEIPFFVALDHKREAVLVAVRGTLSLKGISQAAAYIYRKLVNDGILSQAFSIAPYKILLHGCWYEVFGGSPDDFPTEMENRREEQLSRPLLGEESLLVQGSTSYQSLSSDDSPTHSNHLPLYMPGRILYITEEGPSRRLCFSQVRYRAEWSSATAFNSLLISPHMLTDHMPDVVHKALLSLTKERQSSLCHSSASNAHLNVI
ncbi:Sn1-specific diacylglycerol lipase beta [Bagarius yarrelli]|uniref:Sn1-specific diacylglycerol lipase beta n=1 Tax=Bagarius yarrelli TaxID=175774 RepID=A0A556TIL7_BAGYA|nr:Sn1-specific diacylglycerol lipase beta [Bagarius yarrelli]